MTVNNARDEGVARVQWMFDETDMKRLLIQPNAHNSITVYLGDQKFEIIADGKRLVVLSPEGYAVNPTLNGANFEPLPNNKNPFVVDDTVTPNTVEMRDKDGRVLASLVNVDAV